MKRIILALAIFLLAPLLGSIGPDNVGRIYLAHSQSSCNPPSGWLQQAGQISIGDRLQYGPKCGQVSDATASAIVFVGSNVTIDQSYCGKTVIITGAQNVLTLTAAANVFIPCEIAFYNANLSHAQSLINFPAGFLLGCGGACLYQEQYGSIQLVNNAWQQFVSTGRFRPAFTPTLIIDEINGSPNGDGFGPAGTSSALNSVCTAITVYENNFDFGYQAGLPIIQLTANSGSGTGPLAGDYLDNCVVATQPLGQHAIVFQGSTSNPLSTVWVQAASNSTSLFVTARGGAVVRNLAFGCTGTGASLAADELGLLDVGINPDPDGSVLFGSGTTCDAMRVTRGGGINLEVAPTIEGNWARFIFVQSGNFALPGGHTTKIIGNNDISSALILGQDAYTIISNGLAWTFDLSAGSCLVGANWHLDGPGVLSLNGSTLPCPGANTATNGAYQH